MKCPVYQTLLPNDVSLTLSTLSRLEEVRVVESSSFWDSTR